MKLLTMFLFLLILLSLNLHCNNCKKDASSFENFINKWSASNTILRGEKKDFLGWNFQKYYSELVSIQKIPKEWIAFLNSELIKYDETFFKPEGKDFIVCLRSEKEQIVMCDHTRFSGVEFFCRGSDCKNLLIKKNYSILPKIDGVVKELGK